ncbi:hypothetical protein T484DRAFT_2882087 [Baffinella frigidus]|nr:hypothetical protein T484DRAFT_2882087 [Cryptophyta sp. CCMP2293]
MRPGSSSGWGGRRGTSSARPGTSSGRPGSSRGGGDAEGIWAARRSARSGGHGESSANEASDLTYGTEEIYCGNLARGLRKRNVSQANEKFLGMEARGEVMDGRMSCDEILEELRRWKAETVPPNPYPLTPYT